MDHPDATHRPAGRPLVALIALALVVVLAGCQADEPTDAAAANGLLVLTGQVGDTRLTVREEAHPDGRPVALPDPATAWLSVGRGNVLLATLIDGRLEVSEPLRADDPAWSPVEPTNVADAPPEGPLYFGTWDPDGGAFALLGGDLGSGDGVRIVVVDPNLAGAAEAPVGTRTRPVPPAWIDADRVAVATGTADAPTLTLLDTATGQTRDGPSGVRLLATSADARVAAIWTTDGSMGVLPTDTWLSGGEPSHEITAPDGTVRALSMALDETGARLAIVWADADGVPSRITVHTEAHDWARVASIGLPSTQAAVVAWLR
jgi:hypothetical protein